MKAVGSGTATISAKTVNGLTANYDITVSDLEIITTLELSVLRPGWQTNVTVSLKNYDAAKQPIGSITIEIPERSGVLSFVHNSQLIDLAGAEFGYADGKYIFAYMPDFIEDDTIPAGTEKLFSFSVMANSQIIRDLTFVYPYTVTIGDNNNQVITDRQQKFFDISINRAVIITGDINLNGVVDMIDARNTKQAALKQKTLSEEELKAADVDNDQKVTVLDARHIKRVVLGLDTFDEK